MFDQFIKKIEMNNTPLDPKRTSLDGYFEKVGGSVRSWKKRYFVINENFLYYFKNNDMKDQLGCLLKYGYQD